MGKQHFSEDKPGRGGSGRGSDARGGYSPRSGNGGASNYKGNRPDGREGYSPARPTFGQGGNKSGGRPAGSGYGEKRSFGGERPERGGYGEKRSFGGERSERGGYGEKRSFGGDRSERGSYGEKRSFGGERNAGAFGEKRSFGGERNAGAFGEKRSFGGERSERGGYGEKRSFGGERPERGGYGERRGFGGDRDERPRRFEQNDGGERRDREGAGERPKYPPKPIWQGQPVRYEGQPTVPRGLKGERNRKFIKTNPNEEGGAEGRTPDNARPVYTGRDERRSFEERGMGRDERRPSGNREERRSFGNDRSAAPGRDRTEGAFGKPRSYGERPANTGGTFRERREALRAAESGPRSSTGYGRADKPKFGEKPGEAPDYKNLKHYEADKTRGNKRRRDEEDFGTEEMRLNRYIANAGICSRREADALIAAGEIRVNGEVVTEMGYKVQPTDTVQYGKTNLNREKLVYVLLNKPKDFITTTDDPEGRKTVMSLVAGASKERIFPVGRLDRNTTGLLLFTNDGEVAQKLSHPSHKNKKIYQAELDKPLTADHLGQIAAGLELEDGKAEVDDVAVVAGNPHFVGIELHVGRNRIVRRIFEHLGYDVVALDRVQYAGLTKKDLPRGKWRFLTEQEVIRLKYFM